MHYVKGIDIALEAFAQIRGAWPEAALAVVGPDTEGYGAKVDVLARRLGVSNAVKRLGFVGGREKYQLLAEADLLLLPSRQENFGNVVVEALSVGTPVVASSSTPWRALEEEECGLWGSFDAAGLAVAVSGLLSEPKRRREMGERGRALVAHEFTWDSIAHSMRLVYDGCIARQRPLLHEFSA
jgi:glycosyltransferase involved in cell wall biosynthesis